MMLKPGTTIDDPRGDLDAACFRFAFRASVALAVVLLFAAAFVVTSCSRKSGEPAMFTGNTIAQAELRQQVGFITFFGKQQYAEVNGAWLEWAYNDFRTELSAGQFGVVKWDDRAECTLFASAFEVYCQKRYFAQAFHSSIPAPGIAIGTIWFLETPVLGHAINVVRTERGVRYFEPQTGKFLTLTSDQVASISFRKFD